jgi:hypothetical protein
LLVGGEAADDEAKIVVVRVQRRLLSVVVEDMLCHLLDVA